MIALVLGTLAMIITGSIMLLFGIIAWINRDWLKYTVCMTMVGFAVLNIGFLISRIGG